ncbi:MAG: DUF4251 domain-containing protein [Dysgonomonas sp.]|nr:DUF4251 domain-containing protein [Dysgonomonas sp.]
MKEIILFFSVMIFLSGCKTQDPVLAAAEQERQDLLFTNAIQALNDRDFILEADRITFKYGTPVNVASNTNFISLQGDKATIQIAFTGRGGGPNGIGGITVDGRASNVEVKTDKKGNVSFSMMVIGVGVSAQVIFDMPKGTNYCSATITPNFNSNRTTFTGYLYPREESSVFKGRAL